VNDELGLTSGSLQRHHGSSGNCRCGFGAEVTADQMKAQIETGSSAGRRQDGAVIDIKDVWIDINCRK